MNFEIIVAEGSTGKTKYKAPTREIKTWNIQVPADTGRLPAFSSIVKGKGGIQISYQGQYTISGYWTHVLRLSGKEAVKPGTIHTVQMWMAMGEKSWL